jgi:hypothetical protein
MVPSFLQVRRGQLRGSCGGQGMVPPWPRPGAALPGPPARHRSARGRGCMPCAAVAAGPAAAAGRGAPSLPPPPPPRLPPR